MCVKTLEAQGNTDLVYVFLPHKMHVMKIEWCNALHGWKNMWIRSGLLVIAVDLEIKHSMYATPRWTSRDIACVQQKLRC